MYKVLEAKLDYFGSGNVHAKTSFMQFVAIIVL